jgi:hypothetical protein
VLENHVNRKHADIGRVPVHRLTGRDIRQWMDDLAADGVGVGTISNARRVLGAALAWEVREGRLGVNVATHVRIESSKARRAAMQTVDPVLLPPSGEFATLVETPEDEHDRARRDVQIDRGASLPERLDALWEPWAEAFPNAIPRLGMDWGTSSPNWTLAEVEQVVSQRADRPE